MKPLPLLGYAVLIAAILFVVFSMGGGGIEQSATMAPDLRSTR